jgi:nuclear pore complex protein Nup98-Nup96
MISGDLTLTSNNSQLTNVCENLDWKRQYGLHLWYKCLPINSIHDSIISFEQSLANNSVAQPLPPYLEDTVTSDSKHNQPGPLFDTCFHLIKLYCNDKHPIADTVAPLSHNPNQLDYRLSWHLAMALVSLGYNSVSSECLESLHESYANQLQSIGLWHWSVFVLMHLADGKRRESAVRGYLSRYVTAESELSASERFVVEKLAVPREWVYGLKAQRAKYEHKYENQFKLLVAAHKWNEAHSVLVELLAPDLFIKSESSLLNFSG